MRTTTVQESSDKDLGTYQLEVKQFTITTNVGSNGSVDHSLVTVDYNNDAPSIIISADTNYRIEEIKINGSEVAAAVGEETYDISSEIKNVKDNYTVTAKFYRPTYKITINYNSNGEVKDNSDNPVSNGGKVILEEGPSAGFKAIPFENYHIGNVEIDGTNVEENWGNNYGNYSTSFSDNKSHSVTITFTINTFNVTTSSGDNGTVTSSNDIVDYDGQAEIAITPSSNNYTIETVTINGTDIDIENDTNYQENSDGSATYTIKNIKSDATASATFKEIPYDSGNWSEKASITAVSGTLISEKHSGADTVFTYTAGSKVRIAPVSPYNIVNVKYTYKTGYKSYEGWYEYHDTTNSNIIEVLQVKTRRSNNATTLNLGSSGARIIVIIDNEKPEVANIPAMEWNNTGSYTVNGTVTDENTAQYPSSGLDYVVWSKTSLTNDAVKAETENKATITDGKYSFTLSGEQNQNYYIYAVDVAGNVSDAKQFTAKIDTTKPTVDSFAFADYETSDETGIYASDHITVTVTASDSDKDSTVTNSGVDKIRLLVDGQPYGEAQKATGNKATFTLEKGYFDTLSAYAIDNAGNESEIKKPTEVKSNSTSDLITIDDTVATVTPTKQPTGKHTDAQSRDWYNDNATVTFEIDSNDAGIAIKHIVLNINDTPITEDIEGNSLNDNLGSNKEFTVSTSQTGSTKTGENTITGTVTLKNGKTTDINVSLYIDTTEPVVTGFEFTSKGSTALEKALNFLTFGNFFNEKIEIKVSANDEGDSAGLKKITLYGGKDALGTQPVESGVAKFVVPAEDITDITDETLHLNKTISAKAMDNVNNQTSDFVYPNTTNSLTFKNSGLMIETKKPTIDAKIPSPANEKNSATADTNDWYAEDIDFAFDINDSDSGIRSINASINDTKVKIAVFKDTEDNVITPYTKEGELVSSKENYYFVDKKQGNIKFTINTSQGEIASDGSYTITVSVVDNAGNVSKTYKKTIYKDVDNPMISDFKFESIGYHNDNKVGENGVNQSPVIDTSYGYYFVKDTKVTVTAHDIMPTSGIKSITYYTVDKDGGKSKEKTVNVDANNKIYFTIHAKFKGQIYAKATDNVNNTTNEFANPNSAIVESFALHKKTSSIKYTPAKTDVNGKAYTRTANGQILYAATAKVAVEIVDSYSGIRQIDWEIIAPYDDKNQKGTVTVDNDTRVVSKAKSGYIANCLGKWNKTTEDNLVTKLTNVFTVSNNSNNIKIVITLTDRAGNVTKNVVQVLSIDKTAPKIAIQMNENDDNTYTGFFKVDRTIDVYVYERNFKSSDFNFVVKNTDDNGTVSAVNIVSKFKNIGKTVINGLECNIYKMSYRFLKDGDYSFAVNAKDFSDHKTVDKAVKYSSYKGVNYNKQNDADRAIDNHFTLDHVLAQVTVTYDNNNAKNGKYFNKYRTATITVKEHNFTDANGRITYTRKATKDGKNISIPTVSSWARNGNTYTATIRYGADGDYEFGIDVVDKAGNKTKDSQVKYPNGRETSKSFTVDTTINKPVIGGVENGKSYKGKVIPTIRLDDVNYDSCTYTLLRTNLDKKNKPVTDKYIIEKPANRVTVKEDTFKKIKESDGIYTLTVTMRDKAGNSSKEEATFTVNRFGSVYRYSDGLVALKGAYVNKASLPDKIIITEFNPDKLVKDSVKIEVTRDGAPIDNLDVKVTPIANNSVKIGSSGWYQYEYQFAKSNFEPDGIYTVAVASEDTVGNKPETTNDSEILFRVDSTSPEIVNVKGLEKASVNAVKQDVKYSVYDAIGLRQIDVYLNGKVIDTIKEFEDISNYEGSFTVGSGFENKVKLVITDLAGNVTTTSDKKFDPEFDFHDVITVSTNVFVLWYANKALFWGSVGGAVAVAGVVIFLVTNKRRKKNAKSQPAEQ